MKSRMRYDDAASEKSEEIADTWTKGLRMDQMNLLFGAVDGHEIDYEAQAMREKSQVQMVETVA
ncbi:general substrate transporter [Penicillium malachiteum]|uniref:general substrate transporter n=1 Tax=Penicillium malachiteum TaxID=1324776 RepID=UPI0025473E65|nr:general substrate transporter [Penicillium malachiteum]KAJ5721024.1 general substrate transporter [Penicillium malachiteum]